MESQDLFNVILGIAMLMAGWIMRTVWSAVRDMQRDMKELERGLPDTYLRRDDYKDDMADIKRLLEGISNKLDAKVDK